MFVEVGGLENQGEKYCLEDLLCGIGWLVRLGSVKVCIGIRYQILTSTYIGGCSYSEYVINYLKE